MSTITCLKELNKRKCIKLGDIVIFTVNEKVITHKVYTNYLRLLDKKKDFSEPINTKIFRVLNINKNELAEKAYKYKASNNCWPSSKNNDYPALTKLVRELYTIIEEKEPKYTPYNRFEIMDI